ncbi:hypothetical protein CRUP_019209 [Coryphaenoides rupestris]|nr:hypothetical protein CRUP_019209 [Coryphaenoides rupestris]
MTERQVVDAEAGGGVYVEHQYMCSECYELFNSLEDVLVHQQIHNGAEGNGEQEVVSVQDVSEMEESQQYQCLECGTLLVNSDELLQHQEMHMREAGMEVEHQELCEVLEPDEAGAEGAGPVKYQCLDCLALFDSPDDWLEHRKSHSRSSTHSKTETTEYVLQPDGTITLVNSVQNYVLSDQQAEEILAQALADGSTTPSQRLAKPLPPLLSALGPGSQGKLGLPLENGIQRLEIRLAPGVQGQQQQAEMVVIHPYECSECSLLFQTPEDFLQHQGEHFLGQDKESGEAGVMGGFEEPRGREDVERTDESRLRAVDKRGAAAWAAPQRCELWINYRTFSDVTKRFTVHKATQ